jgi:hypothetical protein
MGVVPKKLAQLKKVVAIVMKKLTPRLRHPVLASP